MNLVIEIIDMLSNQASNLENALIKTKVLLHRIGEKGLAEWIGKELNGYSKDDSVPTYRVVKSQVRVTATDGYTRRWKDMPVPLSHLEEDMRNWLNTIEFRESISSLESLVKSKGDTLARSIPPEFWGKLGKGLSPGIEIEYASCIVSTSQLRAVLTQIRSRLLDFVLELEDKLPENATDADIKNLSKEVQVGNILNHAMFGPNTTIVIGNDNTQSLIFFNVQSGNFDSLSAFLRTKGIEDKDVQTLREAISADDGQIKPESKEFGPKVRDWLKVMLGKAVDNSWQIELGIASNLLTNALSLLWLVLNMFSNQSLFREGRCVLRVPQAKHWAQAIKFRAKPAR